MDAQQVEKMQILQSLSSIYSTLIHGSQTETSAARLLFIAYDILKHYWLNIPTPSSKKQVSNTVDKIEEFFKGCADLD